MSDCIITANFFSQFISILLKKSYITHLANKNGLNRQIDFEFFFLFNYVVCVFVCLLRSLALEYRLSHTLHPKGLVPE